MGFFLACVLHLGIVQAHAETFYVEAGSFGSRDDAAAAAALARKAGIDVRVVKRFQLNHGFEFVLLLDGVEDGAAAQKAAADLEKATSQHASVHSSGGAPTPDVAPEQAKTAAQWVSRVSDGLGGPTGGSDALARAPVVHFVFDRTPAHPGVE